MIKISSMTEGTEAGLDVISELLRLGGETELSALNLVSWCERAIKELTFFKDNLKERANVEYTSEMAGKKGEFKLNDFTVLTINSGKGYWIYPSSIAKLDTELKTKQAAAKKDGTAFKQAALPLNSEFDFLFRIKILKV